MNRSAVQDAPPNGRSIPELLAALVNDALSLIRQEIRLARHELSRNARALAAAAGAVAVAAALGVAALGALTACAILALALVLPGWLAALIVAVVFGGVAGILALGAAAKVRAALTPPEQTLATLKEDVEWTKAQARSAPR